MAKASLDILVRDLARLLNGLRDLYGELAMHMRHKLDAIKRADTDQIAAITAREFVLADRAREREGLRRQFTQRILGSLGLSQPAGQSVRLTALAEHLAEPARSQLLVAAAGLRDRIEEIDRMRVTTTLVTHEMLKHLGEVLSAMRSGGPSDAYGRTGHRQGSSAAHVFEAVG